MLLYQIVAELLPLVAVIYLFDCLTWMRAPGVVFVQRSGGGWRLRRQGFRLLPLLPWLRAYSAVELPYLMDGSGLWIARHRDLVPGRFYERSNFVRLSWEQLATVRLEHRYLHLEGATIRFPSPAHAAAHALRLETLRRLGGTKREVAVAEEEARALRLGSVSELDTRIRNFRRPLDLLCTILFLTAFVAVPVSVVIPVLSPALPWLLLLAVAQLLLVGTLVVRTAWRLEGAGMRTDGILLPLVLSPPSLMRASIELSEHLLQGVEAATVGVALLDRSEGAAVLRRELHAARYAAATDIVASEEEAVPSDDVAWRRSWERRAHLLERLAGQASLAVEEIRRPPALEAGAAAYCPQCKGTFAAEQSCPTCSMPALVVDEQSSQKGEV